MINLSTSKLPLLLEETDKRLHLRRFGDDWLHVEAESPLFAVHIDGQRYTNLNLDFNGSEMNYTTASVQELIARFSSAGFEIEHHLKVYQDTALIEAWQVIRSTGDQTIRVSRIDSFNLYIPPAAYELLHYSNVDWGSEFEGMQEPLKGATQLETRFGRSSKGQHPWFALFQGDTSILSGAVAWSGNWTFRFEPLPDGGYALSGGMHDWEFFKDLAPGEVMKSPEVILVLGKDLNQVSQDYASVGRQHWYPRNALSALPPVEWNHWWAYEDYNINETIFSQNADIAAELGAEICVLDAGWFGPSEEGTHWYNYRGDWDMVNERRFPNGIRPLSDQAHALGMKFGQWCEIEALGKSARLAQTHPELVALRDGERLGYICFGNPETQEWAFQTLARLIQENDLHWIKLDFNLDPAAGCNRTDHGHGAGDGLYEHYMGYYRMLDRVRAAFPHVVLENCSSGGMRIDLGLMRHCDMAFLSDPDWPVHNLQILWGATTMLAPDSCLHWSFCEWIGATPPPNQTFNPRDPKLKPHQLDYYTRTAMLNAFGLSQKLIELPAWVAARFDHHIGVYQKHVRRFVREAHLYRLTTQPKRDGSGDRWPAFQYRLPDQTEHLLFVFRLPGAEAERAVRLLDLQPERVYHIEGFEGERFAPQTGRALMDQGLIFDKLPVEGSVLLRVF